MNTYHDYRSPALITASSLNPGELPAEYRIRLAEERAAAEERRRTELLDLTSTANTPSARIRAWERAHGLTLPRAESHPVLKSVAAATHLSLEQVQEEQRRRQTPVSVDLPLA
jgi:hypothetical protein